VLEKILSRSVWITWGITLVQEVGRALERNATALFESDRAVLSTPPFREERLHKIALLGFRSSLRSNS
jgi:hypothetical protein